MKQFSDVQIMAFADGKLDDATSAAVEAALHNDPALAARVARHRALRQRVFAGFADVLDESSPARLQKAAHAPANASLWRDMVGANGGAGGSAAPHPLRSRRSARRWEAMTAMLMVGIVTGAIVSNAFNLFNRGDSSAPIATTGAGMVAQQRLADALSQQLASTQPPDALTKVGISFPDADDHFCRSFTMATGTAQSGELAGLACRNADQRWQIALLVQAGTTKASAGTYRRTGSQIPAPILQEIDRRISGAPLDAAGEQAAAAQRWR